MAEMERVICLMDKMKVLLIAPGCSWKCGDVLITVFIVLVFFCLSLHTLICTECCAILRPADTLQNILKNVVSQSLFSLFFCGYQGAETAD